MQIINVIPKDIYINFEISAQELTALVNQIDRAELSCDKNNEEQVLQHTAFMNFYAMLKSVNKELNGSDS